MSSLSDPNNIGAAPVGDQRRYGAQRTGQGRWAILAGLGILWTDDVDALQLARLDGADQDAAYRLRLALINARQRDIRASDAFDALVEEQGSPAVIRGDLTTLGA